jgi:hypothetical protein
MASHWVCRLCTEDRGGVRAFGGRDARDQHFRSKHRGVCPECCKVFGSHAAATAHARAKHFLPVPLAAPAAPMASLVQKPVMALIGPYGSALAPRSGSVHHQAGALRGGGVGAAGGAGALPVRIRGGSGTTASSRSLGGQWRGSRTGKASSSSSMHHRKPEELPPPFPGD